MVGHSSLWIDALAHWRDGESVGFWLDFFRSDFHGAYLPDRFETCRNSLEFCAARRIADVILLSSFE